MRGPFNERIHLGALLDLHLAEHLGNRYQPAGIRSTYLRVVTFALACDGVADDEKLPREPATVPIPLAMSYY
jgi:hypothetical protein